VRHWGLARPGRGAKDAFLPQAGGTLDGRKRERLGPDKEVAMIDVPLSMKEIEIIRFVIERYRKAMIFEIANTDSRELKQYLREREDLIESLVQKLDSFSGEPDTLND
jgi:hypothetical protein